MLDRARDASRDVEPGRDGLARGADLAVARQPAAVDHGPAGGELGAQGAGQLLGRAQLVGAADAAADRDDDAGPGEVDLLAPRLLVAEHLAVGAHAREVDGNRRDRGRRLASPHTVGRKGARLHRDQHRALPLDPHARLQLAAEHRPPPDQDRRAARERLERKGRNFRQQCGAGLLRQARHVVDRLVAVREEDEIRPRTGDRRCQRADHRARRIGAQRLVIRGLDRFQLAAGELGRRRAEVGP